MGVKPITFNTEMVKAILDGRKTCTRRVIKPQPRSKLCYTFGGCGYGTWGYPIPSAHEIWGEEYKLPDDSAKEELEKRWKPPYHTDDILYVRETWSEWTDGYVYKAWNSPFPQQGQSPVMKWYPSIHMPKEAARIWLKVTDIRVERLHAISEDEARSEGSKKCYELLNPLEDKPIIYSAEDSGGYYVLGFKSIWNSIVKKTDFDIYGWDANPYVWVIEFERCKKPESEETK